MNFVVDRSDWLRGPWDKEVNAYGGEHLGIAFRIIRNSIGFLCGYVKVSSPKLQVHYNELPGFLHDAAHGGLTYSGSLQFPRRFDETEDRDEWWIGFDAGHAGDSNPLDGGPGTYKDVVYMIAQCKTLASAVYLLEELGPK